MSKKSAYYAVHAIAEAFRREFRFGKLLNTMAKAWKEWREIVKNEVEKDLESHQKQKMHQYLNFMQWLLTVPIKEGGEIVLKQKPRFKLIKSALPNYGSEERSPKEILKAIAEGTGLRELKLSDLEKIEVKEVNSRIGGIKPHRICQILWGVHSEIIDQLGEAWTPGDLNEKVVSEAITAYHDRRSKRKQKRSEKKESDSVIIEDVTTEFVENETDVRDILEMLENKEITSSDLNDSEVVEKVRELASGAIQGALTRRLTALS